ncbi:glycosyltransferase family 4 protein [Flavobacterium jejuense]|uniref:Glycosyltransferase family 4 protein n=1 Tax=Flavobacterium jejuense TaxID=1544455 RepID=A0ABX0IQU0_9FLAO|nr:glycosyltransferase family 4 protein [Flavobacterium jejuense]NHN24210.1 glycosyltransferase family 4 protein [Flavobacterium jejuense]
MQNHLVIIGSVWPEPTSTAAGTRMLQLIAMFQKEQYQITFLSSASKSDYSYPLENLNITTHPIKLNDTSFDSLLSVLNPNIVLFDRFMIEEQFGWRVAKNCPNALRILDTEDLHFLRKARETAFKQDRIVQPEDYLSDIFKRELASIYRCDLSLIISEHEMELLTQTFKVDTSILHYIPFLVDPISKSLLNSIPAFSERKHFVSIGNFLHEPNWQTVLQLKKLWKSIKKVLPEAELHVYGSYATEKAKQLHNVKEGFLVRGRAESVEAVFHSVKVLLAPIPYGAGLKGKLLESMLFGLPNVTTEIGSEGMQGDLEWNGFISTTDEDFIEKAIELYQDNTLWQQSQKNGIELINKRFEKSLFENKFFTKINHLLANLNQHRNQNFLGQVFQHQTLQSTKFMSKWIELKNSVQ